MPIPALDPTNTARLWVFYHDSKFEHALQFRYDDTVTTESEVQDAAHAYLTAWGTGLYSITIVRVERASSGSNVHLPVTSTLDADYGSGTMPAVLAPRYVEFTGKDGTGHRWHLTQFSVNLTVPDTYVILPDYDAHVDAARAALNTAVTTGPVTSINALPVFMNSEVPTSLNDHFVVEARG